MNAHNTTKVTLEQCLRNLIAGTQKHLPSGSLTLAGSPFTAQALIQELQSLVDALTATDKSKADWQTAVKNANDTKTKVLPTLESYRAWVVATYGKDPSTLADYGVSPRKVPAPLTAEQKTQAAVKRAATRKARMVMGNVQKKAVKGNVTGIVVTPVASAAGVVAAPTTSAASPTVAAPGATATATSATPHAA